MKDELREIIIKLQKLKPDLNYDWEPWRGMSLLIISRRT